jgi:hypothetical protein
VSYLSTVYLSILSGVTIRPVGIASEEAHGVHYIAGASGTVEPTGIVTEEALGSPTVHQTVPAAGIATAEALGAPTAVMVLSPTGIATGEAFGAPFAGAVITAVGIATAEAFGSPIIHQSVYVVAIDPPAPQVGVPTVDWLPDGGVAQAAYALGTHRLKYVAASRAEVKFDARSRLQVA